MTDDEKKSKIHITSNHQKGGITAHTVNINPTYQRVLSNSIRQKLLEHAPKDKLVVVWAALGDGESFRYAGEIFQFLKIAGYNLFGNGPTPQIYLSPLHGLEVRPGNNFEICVGQMSEAEKQAAQAGRK